MADVIVRIESITINDFKNVTNGTISFDNPRKPYRASVLGLYGQNGSGKTALIDALALLKYALSGTPVPAHYADYISVGKESAHISYSIRITDSDTGALYHVVYDFLIGRKKTESDVSTSSDSSASGVSVTLFDEVLRTSYENGDAKTRLQTVIDTRTGDVFSPLPKYNTLTGKGSGRFMTGDETDIKTDLIVARKLARAQSTSFIFSHELLTVIADRCTDDAYKLIFRSLYMYGKFMLFVIDTSNNAFVSLNALPLTFSLLNDRGGVTGNLMIPLNGAIDIPDEAYDLVKKVVLNMNTVLSQIVPGLTIGISELGTQLQEDGTLSHRIQLVSHKNSKDIPLKYESEGIKKIISILQLLIVVYNQPSVTVAIDELDSGIFEYLLGELLRIISEQGRGQLIFTSHNLRPLETIDRGFVAFTTTNPSNRYIRMSSVKPTNNLRDFYYRDITLGEQNEPVYEPTHNAKIAFAFREAGDGIGS